MGALRGKAHVPVYPILVCWLWGAWEHPQFWLPESSEVPKRMETTERWWAWQTPSTISIGIQPLDMAIMQIINKDNDDQCQESCPRALTFRSGRPSNLSIKSLDLLYSDCTSGCAASATSHFMNHQLNICKNQLHSLSVPCILTDAIFHLPNDPEDLEIIKNHS